MLDIRQLRAEPDVVKAGIARRGEDLSSLDEAIDLDEQQRQIGHQVEELRADIKRISKEVGALHKDGRADEAGALQQRSRDLGEQEKQLGAQADGLAEQIRGILLNVSNIPADECPDGAGEADNVEVRVEDLDPDGYADHQRVPHWEIGTELRILDVDRAVRMSGAMFVMYRGLGARLVRALIDYGLDRNRDAYEEIRPPTLVKTDTMISTGHLPKFEDDAYHLERDDLWAIPTAEVPLTSSL
jgi:seryl-tRNA synthetase